MSKRRIVDEGGDGPNPPQSAEAVQLSGGPMEKVVMPSGLLLYRYRLSSFPPNVQEHQRLCAFLGALISKLMIATGKRLEPFLCIDGRHLDDDFFSRLRESGVPWRALMGFPLIPGLHPFRYLPIAYHINGRDAWNEVAELFVGTGGTALYLTSLPADEFLTRIIQLLLVRDHRGATRLFPVYLPETVLEQLQKTTRPALKSMLECFEFFVGENPAAGSIDIVSASEIQGLVNSVLESSVRVGT